MTESKCQELLITPYNLAHCVSQCQSCCSSPARERKNYESFLFENFWRSRLSSRSGSRNKFVRSGDVFFPRCVSSSDSLRISPKPHHHPTPRHSWARHTCHRLLHSCIWDAGVCICIYQRSEQLKILVINSNFKSGKN